MSPLHSVDYCAGLTRKLRRLPKEAEWIGFERGRAAPQDLGEDISALSNSAVCDSKSSGYMFWGVESKTRRIMGTAFRPETMQTGKEPLETWLRRRLEPQIQFGFHAMDVDGKRVVILEVERAPDQPVSFSGTEYIRAGEDRKRLRDAPDRARKLWRALDRGSFTELAAAERVDGAEVLLLLNCSAYFDFLDLPAPPTRRGVLKALAEDGLVRPCPAGGWDITNLGALLLAERFGSFPGIREKSMRVVRYRGTDRSGTARKYASRRGYANGFGGLLDRSVDLLPRPLKIKGASRRKLRAFFAPVMRDLLANALVHQDFAAHGAGPALEIFADRFEVTNPGEPLVGINLRPGVPPRSRNEALAYLMRRFGYCEERGSGIERVAKQLEELQLPAPRFEACNGVTSVTVFLRRMPRHA